MKNTRRPGNTLRRSLALLLVSLALPALAAVEVDFAPGAELRPEGTLVLPVQEGLNLGDDKGHLDQDVLANVNAALQAADFKSDVGASITLFAQGGWNKVIVLGVGKDELTARELREFGGSAAQLLAVDSQATIYWTSLPSEEDTPAAQIALGAMLGGYRFDRYLNPPEEEAPKDLALTVVSSNAAVAKRDFEREWRGVAAAVGFTRDLVSEPPNTIYPQSFVERTREALADFDHVKIDVLNVRQMEKLNMGALLGVGMGSARPPRLLVIEYSGGNKDEAPVVLVGKGVTFDSGGISLKRASGMWQMKYDMAGAAVVTGTVMALAAREAPINVVAISALVENMPSAQAQRPGDVRDTMCGKTIEIINTDAEGRLILADAVCYAQEKFEPRVLIDVATLTGSAKSALAPTYGALFAREDKLAEEAIAAGQASGEELWRLPLHPSYAETVKSTIADVRNMSISRYAGASTGAHIIGAFIEEDVPWIHLDIAGVAWRDEPSAVVPAGASGFGVLLLNQLLEDSYE